MDPGNWATDLEAGSRFGFGLLWVLLGANLAAKLGLATGLSYPQVCRARFPRPLTLFLWLAAETAAMATDLAEFLGAALGLYLLFHVPLLPAALLTALAVLAILALYRYAVRRLLSHTTGLAYDSSTITHQDMSEAELLDLVARIPVQSEPGTTFTYNDVNADVAGVLIQRVSGLSFAEFVRTRIFEPLGMRDADLDFSRLS